jgi:hypothetical protein
MVGSIRLYSFADEPWRASLTALIREILKTEPTLASRITAAHVIMMTGEYSNRVHLRRQLACEAKAAGNGQKRRLRE